MALLLIALALLGLARITELIVSRRNWQRHREHAQLPKEKLFIAMVALHSSFFLILPLEALFWQAQFSGPLSWTALALVVLTLALRAWTLKTIGSSWNVRIVGGPEYPIVDGGPYRFIRHPNYVVVCLELFLIPMMFQLWRSAILLSALNLLVLRRRIVNEEAMLMQNPSWRAKMAHKPRFLPFS